MKNGWQISTFVVAAVSLSYAAVVFACGNYKWPYICLALAISATCSLTSCILCVKEVVGLKRSRALTKEQHYSI